MYFLFEKDIRMLKKISLSLLCSVLLSANANAQVFGNASMSYDTCLDKADGSDLKMASCTIIEANKILKSVEEKYETLANNKAFANWNSGSGMYSGNFKKLYNEWLQYRDSYCSLDGYSLSPSPDQGSIAELSGAECVLELTKRQNKDMDVVIKNFQQ